MIVIKTHFPVHTDRRFELRLATQAILLVREPLFAIKAEYKRMYFQNRNAKVQHKNQHVLDRTNQAEVKKWKSFFSRYYSRWKSFHQYWLSRKKLKLYILHYHNLLAAPLSQMIKIGEYYNWDKKLRRTICLSDNIEGNFHRPFAHDNMTAAIDKDLQADAKNMYNTLFPSKTK